MNKTSSKLHKYKDMILYIVFGALTTLVNYVVYFAAKAMGIHYQISTVLAWIAAVTFAYITNRIWVFQSKNHGYKKICKEIALFVSARVLSLLLEMLIMYIGMNICNADEYFWNIFNTQIPAGELITKTLAQIIIIITNYLCSKHIIFSVKSRKK